MKSRFIRFLRALIVIVAVINLLFLFVLDGRIPSEIHLPFSFPGAHRGSVEAEEESAEVFTEGETEEDTAAEPEETPEEVTEEEPVEEEPAEEEPVQRCTIISPDGSNIRSGPGSDYEVIASYGYNTVLVVTGEPEYGWYPIQAEDGTAGFIFETQISMLEEETQNETEEQPQY